MMKPRIVGLVAAVVALTGVMAAPAQAHNKRPTRFVETDLISNLAGKAQLQDPLLKNAWGLALGPTTPLWVADNGTDTATVYGTDATGVVKRPIEVAVAGAPTGQVFNDTTADFMLNGSKALFIFDTESGTVAAWNPTAGMTAVNVGGVDGAIYKGLALLHTDQGAFLLAADFHHARIEVFDTNFAKVKMPKWAFRDPFLPRGYAPFNVTAIGDAVYVSYAKQDADAEDEVAGRGLGFVDVYRDFGKVRHRLASRGPLNAPWAVAVAPPGFGTFAGDILVGNFGDGRINAFDSRGHFRGPLRLANHKPVDIDGLWALLPGTATTGGTDSLWFSAGPNDEEDGLVGLITAAP
ncbi:MAG TPA: TIGR03118 family protein [Streptosporangiaceae bacterium]|jgi:uncharacterized protein (TIGR03118 family)